MSSNLDLKELPELKSNLRTHKNFFKLQKWFKLQLMLRDVSNVLCQSNAGCVSVFERWCLGVVMFENDALITRVSESIILKQGLLSDETHIYSSARSNSTYSGKHGLSVLRRKQPSRTRQSFVPVCVFEVCIRRVHCNYFFSHKK